ncbi:hypothetical protein GCK72_008004 [Caenorhabditis remanei]|uniref:F-box domain-containing protein n=1 Tax=Caenorhabditis remanei TaxID=31234 RepID=A0A6A5HNX2_CAERE|nr:hypothetical protein GCK72_008004 [Caenorhabditis remanei]KAF1768043.1 hypothetical protein GCK72_008004 [Caenorhabditis remanei]
MPPPLSYPALKCVLEFLDPARRIHIAARSPSLQRIEKPIPLVFDSHHVCYADVILNSTLIQFGPCDQLQFCSKGEIHKSYKPGSLSVTKALTRMLENYFGERAVIRVNKAYFDHKMEYIHTTTGFTYTVNEIDSRCPNFAHVLPFINPDSFPLKKLATSVNEPEHLNYPAIRFANELKMRFIQDCDPLQVIAIDKLCNKSVFFDFKKEELVDVMALIRYWIDNGRELESTFIFPFQRGKGALVGLFDAEFGEFKNTDISNNRYSIPIRGSKSIHVTVDKYTGDTDFKSTATLKIVSSL